MPEGQTALLRPASLRPWLIPVTDESGNIPDPERDRDAWIRSRLGGLGGSDVSAILGENPKKTAIDVWSERMDGVLLDDSDNERTRRGRKLEPVVLGWYENGGEDWPRHGGRLVLVKPPTVYHRDRPWQRASADGLLYDPDTVVPVALAQCHASGATAMTAMDLVKNDFSTLRQALYYGTILAEPDHGMEAKTHGWSGAKQYDSDDDGVPVQVPSHKRVQCLWYMAAFKLPRWNLAALVDTHLARTYAITHDQQVEDYLLEETERWWTRHIVGRVMPDPDGSASFRKYLSKRFEKNSAEIIDSTPEVDEAAAKLREVKAIAKATEKEQELLEQVIKKHIGEAAGVRTAIGDVTFKFQPSGKIRQTDALADLYDRCGMTDDEREAFRAKYATDDVRMFRMPTAKRGVK